MSASRSMVRLKHLARRSLEYGAAEAAAYDRRDWPRYIRTTDIRPDSTLRDDTFVSLPPKVARPYLLEEGDLLFTRSGATVGKSFMYRKGWGPSAFAGYLIRVRLDPNKADPRYVSHFCKSSLFWNQISRSSVQATIQNVNAEQYGNLEIPYWSVEDQRRIADFLDAETARIDKMQDALVGLKAGLLERRASALHGHVTGAQWEERKSSGLAWVEKIPRHWKSARLNLFARMGSGHTPSRSRPEWWINPEFNWITTGEVSQVRDDRREVITATREMISRAGLDNSSAVLHPKGTVVLCRTASAGYSAVMGHEMATSQDFVTWTCGNELNTFYLLWCLRAMRSDLLGRLAMGSTHKTIYVPDLQMLRIPIPPLDEQRVIVEKIRAGNAKVDALVDSIDRQAGLLRERREALITAAVTGEWDVTTARR
ncbi:hypothetical protein GCM10027589_00540 [Actinocorallia lasiicapitis]